jgi:hypothetical protein
MDETPFAGVYWRESASGMSPLQMLNLIGGTP